MAIKKCGFQEAVTFLEPFREAGGLQIAARKLQVESRPAEASENPPFKGVYEKFAVPSAWLKKRGFESRALEHFEVFEYNNPTIAS
jgi:hypothetical protein